ncbi:MAG: iron uptake porin [Microcoleaceae cyanobacterium]
MNQNLNTIKRQVKAGSLLIPVLLGMIGAEAVNAMPPEPYIAPGLLPEPEANLNQVTSVSQLSDVQPTDWAFQALQSLVERYGCIAGYPDGTYKGNRAMTRYEFAAGLSACLDRVNELLASTTANLVTREDVIILQRLQEEFAAELVALRGRITALEARTAELEANQFSTTTKLNAQVFFNLTHAASGDDVRFEAAPGAGATGRFRGARDASGQPLIQTEDDAETTLSGLVWFNFDTSFTGRDKLSMQLAAGNGVSPANQFASAGFFNAFGVPFTDQVAGQVANPNDLILRELFYSFPVTDNVRLTVGPRVNWYRHFDNNRFTFYLFGAGSYNSSGSTQLNTIDRGSGAVLEWDINSQLSFSAAYLGENTEFLASQFGFNTASNAEFGLFGGTNTTTAQLTYSPSNKINLRFIYNHSRIQAYNGQIGGALGEPVPYGYLDAGPGNSIFNPATGQITSGGLKYAAADTFAFNFDWLITQNFGLFGRYAYGITHLEPIDEDVESQSFQIGLAFPNLGKQAALGTLTFLMPMDIISGEEFFASGSGDGGNAYELEASYYFPINDYIALVPAFYTIWNPNNFNSNPAIFIGNLRAQFRF